MNYKTYTSKLLSLKENKSITLDDISMEVDERGIINGIVYKDPYGNRDPVPAKNALVSLYDGCSLYSSHPIYHTYTDEKGAFLFPAYNPKSVYRIKVFYWNKNDDTYKPFLSGPFRVASGSTYKIICYLERDNRKIISGKLTNIHKEPRADVPVKLFITIGPDKIPIIQLASSKTDAAGRFEFDISPEGNYCILISV